MPRFTDDELSRLKTDISLLLLIQRQGYKVIKQGKDYALSCPFHSGDDTPSLVVSPASNLFHCFGCDAAGSVIDWVMKTQGVSFRHALEILREDHSSLAANEKAVKKSSVQKLDTVLSSDSDVQLLLNQVVDYYHASLKQSAEALDYLNRRGLGDMGLIEHFKLGYANRTLGYRLPSRKSNPGRKIRLQLQEVGILRSNGHEHFRGSIVVPIMDKSGHVLEIYGRKTSTDALLRKESAKHLYLPGAHSGLWNSAALAVADEMILCEALLDAMTLWVHGFRNVTSSYGTGGFSDEMLEAFKDNKIKRVLIAYDRDDAGNRAADKLSTLLSKHAMESYRLLLPLGMDINAYALQQNNPAEALGHLIRQSSWLSNGINTATDRVVEQAVTQAGIDNLSSLAATAASPIPSAPTIEIDAKVSEHEVHIDLGNRHYRIRGLTKAMSYEQLKVNVLVSCGDAVHVDSFDLYQSRIRSAFIKQAAVELGCEASMIKTDLGKVLLKLEQLQDEQIKATLRTESEAKVLTEAEHLAAMELLQDGKLLDRIVNDLTLSGVIGEDSNKLVGYLACVSRLLDKPLAVVIQSSSAAGKSSLMDAILNLVPTDARVQYSAMTGQSLFYMGETNLKHKILAIAEEAGAEQASYALKLLQSEGELTIASTGKDDSSGDLVTKEYRVEGPVMLFLTTTAIDIDEELMNRCLVLSVNESRQQTQAIHALQRKQQTLSGLLAAKDKQQAVELHRNAQSLLRSLLVANPFAEQLTFIDDKTRTRRDHMKYLTLIRSIALLHQYQREVKTVEHKGEVLEYIEVIAVDIEVANRLAHDVLGRSLDELPAQTRNLLQLVYKMVNDQCQVQNVEQQDYRFSRKVIRQYVGWSDFQVRTHLARLVELEYLLVHRGGRGQSFVYELLYCGEGEDGQSFLLGLSTMDDRYDTKFEGSVAKNERSTSIQRGVKEPPVSSGKNSLKVNDSKAFPTLSAIDAKDAIFSSNTKLYHNHSGAVVGG